MTMLHCGSWVLLLLLARHANGLTVRSEFNQRGVRGSVEFTQDEPTDNTTISVNLTGLSFHNDNLFLWHVHEYPFPLNGLPNPCRRAITGGHYDPLGANLSPNYTQNCAQDQNNCEIGDLSGKFGPLNTTESDTVTVTYIDPTLSLHGVYSVIGRSIVIHLSNGDRIVCANIDYPEDSTNAQTDMLYSPFRADFTGSIYFRGHTDINTSAVYSDLLRVSGGLNSIGHNWHVHESPLDMNGTDCGIAGPHYNPFNVDTTGPNYYDVCNPLMQHNCEIGDLSNKGAPFDVVSGVVKQFYTDISLPLVGDIIYIINRSVVIHAENRTGPRISCANITRFNPLEAVVTFNESGITGTIRFSQLTPFDPTFVTVTLQGLAGIAGGYHVHVAPVPPEGAGRCDLAQGHWNPTEVTYDNPPSRPRTSDEYEIGDLSMKFGGLNNLSTVMETYSDPNVPLFGRYSILGRSVVIHYAINGSRLTCANIGLVRPVIQVTTLVNTSVLSGRIVFTQPADNPFAETTITVELEVLQEINVTLPSVTPTPSRTVTSTVDQTSTMQVVVTGSLTSSMDMMSMSSFQTVPATSSVEMVGSGDSTMELLPSGSTSNVMATIGTTNTMGQAPSVVLMPSNTARRKRQTDSIRTRRQALMMVGFDWSVRTANSTLPTDCSSLRISGSLASNSSLCNPNNPLACAVGDLTAKHGSLSLPTQPGPFTAVFSDPNLPLSGPQSPFTAPAAVLVQQMDGMDESASCSLATVEEPSPSTTAPPTTETISTTEDTPTTPSTTQPVPGTGTDVLIGAIVGGVLGALLLVVIVIVIILLVVCCRGKKSQYKVSKQSAVELGTVRPTKPILGVPHYRALHDYAPQNEDDLQLVRGDWVTLEETPLGGGWWKGSVEGRGEGWFPRTYVEYVDMEAERKRQQEENFLMAASAIVAASTSFNAQHPSLTQTRHQTMPTKTKRTFSFSKKKEEKIDLEKVQRSQTMSRRLDIDSTPRAPRKLDRPYLADDETTEATIIANEGGEPDANGDKCPDTPQAERNAEFYANKAAVEGSPQSRRASEQVTGASPLDTDRYIVKYHFNGSTDIELELKKDAIVSVVEKSDDGWWKGVSEGRAGWFPESYVRPAPVESREDLLSSTQPATMEEMMKTGEDLEVVEYRSIFPYQSDTEGDLEFGEGETVLVYWAQDNGWWYGAVGSAQGWFPGSFVELVVDLPEPQEKRDLRSSFKKMWSLRKKSRDKTKEDKVPLAEKATNDEEKLPAANEQPTTLEGQLQAALERRRSFGRGRNLAVDEEAARGRRKSEPHKSRTEIVADFMRRSFKRGKRESKEEVEVIENEGVAGEAAVKEQPPETPQQGTPTQKPSTQSTPPTPRTPGTPGTPSKRRRDTKARRAPPPPPTAATPTAATPTATNTISEVPGTTSTQTPPTTQAQPATPKQEPSRPNTEVARPSPPQPQVRQTGTAEDTTKTTRSYSTAQNSSQPAARPRKRLTTAAGTRGSLPHRRPPPPPPGGAKVAPPTTPSAPPDHVISTVVEEANTMPVEPTTPAHPPVPRPRVQRVKRPISRMIPPPPNVPLPPPPVRKIPRAEPVPDSTENRKTSTASTAEKRESVEKPPVAPKPSHLRRFSTPASPTSPAVPILPITPVTPSTPDTHSDLATKPLKPKPPPPTRSSSLASRPVLPQRKITSPELKKIEDEREEVDSPPLVTEQFKRASRSAPPKRPPPPRPTSAAGNRINKVEEPPIASGGGSNTASVAADSDDKEALGHSLRSKGTSLMRSLKKMVTRDSRKGSEKSHSLSKEEIKVQPLTKPTVDGSLVPVPKPRARASDATAPGQESPTTKPARPPPPRISPTQQKRNSVPAKPPPPKSEKLTEPNSSVVKEDKTSSQENTVAEKPVPAPRQRSPSPNVQPDDPDSTSPDQDASSSDANRPGASPDTNFFRATKKYEAQNDKELSFSKGDVLIIVNKGDDGFHFGMLDDGTTGLFPLHAVEPFL